MVGGKMLHYVIARTTKEGCLGNMAQQTSGKKKNNNNNNNNNNPSPHSLSLSLSLYMDGGMENINLRTL
jgi:hypothetical protein